MLRTVYLKLFFKFQFSSFQNCVDNFRALLRVLFVSELVKAPSNGYPAEVSVDFLLDETTAFFMPVNPEETEEGRIKRYLLIS